MAKAVRKCPSPSPEMAETDHASPAAVADDAPLRILIV
jgi:hypothetical protein